MKLIQLQDASFRYQKKDLGGLNHCHLSVHAQEQIALLGASGSGKTTLLKILCHQLSLESGTFWQTENLKLVHNLNGQESDAKLEDFILQNVEKSEENINKARDLCLNWDLSQKYHYSFSQLSQGEQQRAFLCQVFIAEPQLILLDEPFSHLDPPLRHQLMQQIVNYCQTAQIALVFSTHDLDLALNWSNRICLLHHGEIVQDCGPLQFLLHPQHLANLDYQRFINRELVTYQCQDNQLLVHSQILGEISLPKQADLGRPSALLLIPPQSWQLTAEQAGEFSAKICQRQLTANGFYLQVELLSTRPSLQWVWHSTLEDYPHLSLGQHVKLSLNRQSLKLLAV